MSKKNQESQAFNKTRRNFIKAAAYASGLSIGGLSGLAFAKSRTPEINVSLDLLSGDKTLGNTDIRILQETLHDRERVTLINQSGKLQMLDARQPISLHQANGVLIVTVNQNDVEAVNGMVLMSPNERFTFDLKAIGIDVSEAKGLPPLTNLAENQLQINSEHSVFNRIVPVQLV